jgi:hypothetical protein
MLGVWLLLTSIPYYTLCTYNWAIGLGLISDKARFTNTSIQPLSSAFFNSNHCTNILIYIMFHRGFRAQLFEFIAAFFNLNPLVKMNPYYFAGRDDKSRQAKSSSFMRSLKRCSSEEMDSYAVESVIRRNLNVIKTTKKGAGGGDGVGAGQSRNASERKKTVADDINLDMVVNVKASKDDENERLNPQPSKNKRLTRQSSMFEECNVHAVTTPSCSKLFLLNQKSSLFKYYKRVKTEMAEKAELSENHSYINESAF